MRYLLLLLLTGCAGTLEIRTPDGGYFRTSRDTTIGSLSVIRAQDGSYSILASNYSGRATEPINANAVQIKAIGEAVTQTLRQAAELSKGAVLP